MYVSVCLCESFKHALSIHCSYSVLPPAVPPAHPPQGHGLFPSGVLELITNRRDGRRERDREMVRRKLERELEKRRERDGEVWGGSGVERQ